MTNAPEAPAGHQDLIAHAVGLQREGRLEEAADVYRAVLAQFPGNFDATHLLGLTALELGNYAEAQLLIRAAVGIDPHDAQAIGHLGISFLRAGELKTAFRWLSIALALHPESPSALFNAATALCGLGRYREAVPMLQTAYAADPTSYGVCLLLGECLLACGEARKAAEAFDAATYAEPESGEAWLRLSVALSAADDLARARECAARATSLGAAPATAVPEERREPKRSAADPPVSMLSDLAYILLHNGLHDEAIETLATALALDPSNLSVRWTLAIARLKPVYRDASDMQVARAAFAQAMDETAAWCQQTPGITDAFKTVGVIQPFFVSYQPFNNRELLMRHGSLCCAWMATMPNDSAEGLPLTHAQPPASPVGRRLRLGIASTQIRDHSTWNAITKGWVTNIDPDRFEVFIFQLNGDGDQQTELARRSAAHVENRPASLPEWVQAIRHASLDVLLYPSVGMDPLTLQLGSLRLAPVQAAAWGHPETTGLPTIDLYVSAEAFEPPDAGEHYCEKLVRLPNLGVYVEPLQPKIVEIDLHSLGLPDDVPLLLCPGAPFKYSPLDDDVWVEIARQLTRGVFRKRLAGRLVFFRGRAAAIDRMLEGRLRAAFARGGVDFDLHVTYLEHLERPRFFGLLRRSALMLDTLGFSGFNLAVQAMECGLPLLAYEGEFLRGRLASAVLRRLELPELVATNKQDFIRKAVRLALDDAKRAELRAAISDRCDALYRDVEPVRALEKELTAAFLRSRC